MNDATRDRPGPAAGGRSARTDGGVHFEETIALSDSSMSGLVTLANGIALVAAVALLVFVPVTIALFVGGIAFVAGRSVVDLVATIFTAAPLFSVLMLGGLGFVMIVPIVLAVGMFFKRGGMGPDEEIHTRVTDGWVEIDRQGANLGQSSGVDIPLEAVTAVEYNDPGGDLKLNLEDVSAKKFIGGRGGDWVRIERSDGPAVYVGSDRPRALADVVADVAPGVDGARPFS